MQDALTSYYLGDDRRNVIGVGSYIGDIGGGYGTPTTENLLYWLGDMKMRQVLNEASIKEGGFGV